MGNSFPRPEDDFHDVCVTVHDPNGPLWLQYTGRGLQWVTFVISWGQLAFYGYQSLRTTLGWEETYVCVIEAIKITFDIFFMYSTPATIYQTNGNTVSWLTYSEWLLTCPVILVQLCNITGLESDFTHRTMQVLVSDVGAIVLGVYAAFSEGWAKMVFFMLGCCYGAFTFYHAAKVYVESYYTVPKGVCRKLVKYMAWCFYISWVGFPVIFVAGPDGFGQISIWAEVAAQQICELLAKNVWGIMGHLLRVKIHEHIVKYGDVRKAEKVKFAGNERVVMSWVEEDEAGETVRNSAGQILQRRESFVKVRDNMKQRGISTRKSMDGINFDPELARQFHDAPANPPAAVFGNHYNGFQNSAHQTNDLQITSNQQQGFYNIANDAYQPMANNFNSMRSISPPTGPQQDGMNMLMPENARPGTDAVVQGGLPSHQQTALHQQQLQQMLMLMYTQMQREQNAVNVNKSNGFSSSVPSVYAQMQLPDNAAPDEKMKQHQIPGQQQLCNLAHQQQQPVTHHLSLSASTASGNFIPTKILSHTQESEHNAGNASTVTSEPAGNRTPHQAVLRDELRRTLDRFQRDLKSTPIGHESSSSHGLL